MSVAKGDKVTIASGAKYYGTSTSIPSWVIAKTWIVSSISGDRAVLDKSTDGKSSICSPVSTSYLTVVGSGGGTSSAPSNRITNVSIVRESGRRLVATWTWNRENTDHYTVRWWYMTYLGIPTLGEEKDVGMYGGNCTYTMPDNPVPTKVWFHVKPVAKTHKVNDSEVAYWTADWSTQVSWYDTIDLPNTPPVPDVELDDYKLIATVDGADPDQGVLENSIEFEIVQDNSTIYDTMRARSLFQHASIECAIEPGHSYKVRARLVQYPGKLENPNWTVRSSEWSAFSSNYETKPSSMAGFTSYKAASKTSIYLAWTAVTIAESYDIQYATSEELNIQGTASQSIASYFNSSSNVHSATGIEDTTSYTLSGLETGHTYYLRVRAVNDQGESEWSTPVSVTIGTKPQSPTTWSSTTTVMVGEELILYWVHNSVDNSSQTYAQLGLKINGGTETYRTIQNTTDEEERDKTSVFYICTEVPDAFDSTETYAVGDYVTHTEGQTTKTYRCKTAITTPGAWNADNWVEGYSFAFSEGGTVEWRVRTAGVTATSVSDLPAEFGDWSVQRKVDVYAQPTITMQVLSSPSAVASISTITSYPFYISASTQPATQTPLSYHLSVIANQSYETVDSIGNAKIVNAGEEVYSKYFDVSTALLVEFTPNKIDLANNISYTVKCIAAMNSGLTAEATSSITVAWAETAVPPNAEITVEKGSFVAHIRPYCEYAYGVPVEDISLAVYRREFDGTFTEIATGISNTREINNVVVGNIVYVTDPHPSLDYARYRIVATSDTTGAVGYYDVPAYPVGEKAVIIQWEETWSSFDVDGEGQLAVQPWHGSLIRLPYNIDISDSYDQDVALVKYIGRKRPVSYYGTQLGETSTWNVEIPKSDKETLYAIRRLAIWTGDVYVREPSGSGYWANISVSFGQKHAELTIPVTFQVTRVEGGM